MQPGRPVFAEHLSAFGRAPAREFADQGVPSRLWSDVKLFVLTFSAGFLFVSILIG
jgi:hypothetical protein